MKSSPYMHLRSAIALILIMNVLPAGEAPRPPRKVQAIDWSVTWIGNTFGGPTWVQHHHEAMHVKDDGTVVLNSNWDEGHRECGLYKDGQVVGMLPETGGGRGGWAVTGNENYIFASLALDWSFKQRGPARFDWTGKPAGWPGAKKGNRLPLTGGKVTGMACHNGELFAGDSKGRVVVLDAETMKTKREFAVASPGKIAIHPTDGTLWILQAGENGKRVIAHYSPTGEKLPQTITGIDEPTDVAFAPSGILAIPDNGPRQQILLYDVSADPVEKGSVGKQGGVLANDPPGTISDDAFYGLGSIDFDAAGNLYVGQEGARWGGLNLRCYGKDKALDWQIHGLAFVDCASIDPGDENSIYFMDTRVAMDWDAPDGENWKPVAHTSDKFTYPGDFRLKLGGNTASIRRIDGKRILYVMQMNGGWLQVLRFDGEIARNACLFTANGIGVNKKKGQQPWHASETHPKGGRSVWRDLNGDAVCQADEWVEYGSKRDGILGWPDMNGGIWSATWGGGVRYHPCEGLDENGVPVYRKERYREWESVAPFVEVNRLKYIPETDTLYVSGFTEDRKRNRKNNHFIPGGAVIIRYDGWVNGEQRQVWRANLDYSKKYVIKSFDVAGDFLFTVGHQNSVLNVYDAASGEHIMELVPPEKLGKVANHVMCDIPYAIQAYQRKNGEYVVIQEEDAYAKNIVWRILAKE